MEATVIRSTFWCCAATVVAAASLMLSPLAQADTDTDFANDLHMHGIYGPRDYNAWIGKIACKRLTTQLDDTVFETATFLKSNLDRATTTEQTWQFLGAAVATYCPEHWAALRSATESTSPTARNH